MFFHQKRGVKTNKKKGGGALMASRDPSAILQGRAGPFRHNKKGPLSHNYGMGQRVYVKKGCLSSYFGLCLSLITTQTTKMTYRTGRTNFSHFFR